VPSLLTADVFFWYSTLESVRFAEGLSKPQPLAKRMGSNMILEYDCLCKNKSHYLSTFHLGTSRLRPSSRALHVTSRWTALVSGHLGHSGLTREGPQPSLWKPHLCLGVELSCTGSSLLSLRTSVTA